MAPLTRNRAQHGTDAPRELNAEYYAQRADAGLIVAEATQISPYGKGYAWTPGIYSPEQIAGWKRVTSAVHERGGAIFLQLWHVGRFSHPSLQPGGLLPVAPSAIAPKEQRTFLENGDFAEVGMPRALDLSEIPGVIDDFADAARKAIEAGFDGVEIHGANGYLLDQFLRDGSNARTDRYGGSVENRMRLTLEVTEAVIDAVGAGRTGIRISPVSGASGAYDSDPQAVFFPLVRELGKLGLAYVHAIEGQTPGSARFQGLRFQRAARNVRRAVDRQQRLHARDGDRGGEQRTRRHRRLRTRLPCQSGSRRAACARALRSTRSIGSMRSAVMRRDIRITRRSPRAASRR